MPSNGDSEPREEIARGSNGICSPLKNLTVLCATVLLQSKLSERQAITDGSGRLVTVAVNAGKSSQNFAACIFYFFLHIFIEICCLVDDALLKVRAEKPGMWVVSFSTLGGNKRLKSLAHTHAAVI